MSKILLILGSGVNVGAHTAKAFAAQGYKVASASRTAPKTPDGSHLHVTVDLSKPETVPEVFEKVRQEFGGEPSVVVYNDMLVGTFNKCRRAEERANRTNSSSFDATTPASQPDITSFFLPLLALEDPVTDTDHPPHRVQLRSSAPTHPTFSPSSRPRASATTKRRKP
ncbi:hypothetical protein CLCR_03669 [Cladophialophora carrionii]|uniref:Uncharacterized protein n=1 Tax=Cladophialophora carrionii TaxID=86049 RepID=A0A1C1CGX2_9EURO|nr:hypothetical protein CLCR_03669 [Cladophialophora carrionii]